MIMKKMKNPVFLIFASVIAVFISLGIIIVNKSNLVQGIKKVPLFTILKEIEFPKEIYQQQEKEYQISITSPKCPQTNEGGYALNCSKSDKKKDYFIHINSQGNLKTYNLSKYIDDISGEFGISSDIASDDKDRYGVIIMVKPDAAYNTIQKMIFLILDKTGQILAEYPINEYLWNTGVYISDVRVFYNKNKGVFSIIYYLDTLPDVGMMPQGKKGLFIEIVEPENNWTATIDYNMSDPEFNPYIDKSDLVSPSFSPFFILDGAFFLYNTQNNEYIILLGNSTSTGAGLKIYYTIFDADDIPSQLDWKYLTKTGGTEKMYWVYNPIDNEIVNISEEGWEPNIISLVIYDDKLNFKTKKEIIQGEKYGPLAAYDSLSVHDTLFNPVQEKYAICIQSYKYNFKDFYFLTCNSKGDLINYFPIEGKYKNLAIDTSSGNYLVSFINNSNLLKGYIIEDKNCYPLFIDLLVPKVAYIGKPFTFNVVASHPKGIDEIKVRLISGADTFLESKPIYKKFNGDYYTIWTITWTFKKQNPGKYYIQASLKGINDPSPVKDDIEGFEIKK